MLLEKQVEGRQGGWIQTFTGGRIWPLDPRPEEIDIEDIAHALSNLCRFGGHVSEFYSVAQHSLIVSRLIEEKLGLPFAIYGLLHDASEAYLIDVPRPIKHSLDMQPYRDAENRMEKAICAKFGLQYPMPDEIKWADRVALRNEQQSLMRPPLDVWEEDRTPELVLPYIRGLSPKEAKYFFMEQFKRLMA
jgi:hypothetical protein